LKNDSAAHPEGWAVFFAKFECTIDQLMEPGITIVDFENTHQPGIDRLMDDVQKEFSETIYGPGSKKIIDVAFLPDRKYWVALQGNVVIGTIGVVLMKNGNAALKSMILQKEYRGSHTRIADNLFRVAKEKVWGQHATQLFLGTMIQFKAAQAFYVKHGFIGISEDELPADFVKNPVDKVFFKLLL
jgi:N-acetylglutamate synthase-like GNAT family acetyltransferase